MLVCNLKTPRSVNYGVYEYEYKISKNSRKSCGFCHRSGLGREPSRRDTSNHANIEQLRCRSESIPNRGVQRLGEAGMLQNAYLILDTGDHDYKGHRVRAMHQIEAAAKLLGMNLSGDAKDKQPQPLSDAKLREAQGLLQNVLGAAEVKNQERVTKHITNAVNQINTALSIR